MKNNYILILALFLSSLALAAEARVVGIVFHRAYCEKIPEALESYLMAVRNKGYDVVDVCVSASPDSALKRSIEAEAKKKNIKWTDIEGINIVGPVVNTLLLPSLSHNPKQRVFSAVGLMFDDLSFSYNNSYLTGVQPSYLMPNRVRWVSQLFAEDTSPEQVAKGLLKAETLLASPEEKSYGKRFSDRVLADLNERRARMTDNWSSYPNGIGWNLMTYAFTAGAWYITGASREMWGYSATNRLQTTTDKFMYSLVIYPAFALINAYSTYSLAGHLFGRALPNDKSGWKKYVLNKRLLVDGLAGRNLCDHSAPIKKSVIKNDEL